MELAWRQRAIDFGLWTSQPAVAALRIGGTLPFPCGVRLFNRKCKRDPSINMDAPSTRKVCLPSDSVAGTFLPANPPLFQCTLLLNDDLFHKDCLLEACHYNIGVCGIYKRSPAPAYPTRFPERT